MNFFDWLIVLIPLTFVMMAGFHSRKYVRSVADYVQAGRICGRYVISAGDVANAVSIIMLITYIEITYQTGFSLGFWNSVIAPLGILLSLYGYCSYRFRETKALSLGQFLEIRYSRSLRIFAAALRSVAELIANMIMPALAARFYIYYLGLPTHFSLFGLQVSTFGVIVFISLALAISLICFGGTLSLVVTDAIQGIILYPVMLILLAFLFWKFDWGTEIVQVISDRAPGESFLNPYDLEKLRDFNLFSLFVTAFVTIMHRASWMGAGTDGAAKSPHEQKMAGLLGAWRNYSGYLLYLMIAVALLTFMNHKHFAAQAAPLKAELSTRISQELIVDENVRADFSKKMQSLPVQIHEIGKDAPLSQKENLDTPYLNAAHQEFLKIEKEHPDALKDGKNGNAVFAQFQTLYNQQMMSVTMRKILPAGILGIFCVFMVLSMLSTDDTRIFSATLTITQDVIAPFCDMKKLNPKTHIWIFRIVAILIGVLFFTASFLMSQLDYLQMYATLVCMMWLGGCGPVMIFGLYSRFGTTAGAFTSLIAGMLASFGTIFVQRSWADYVYPWLDVHGWVEPVGEFLTKVSAPFNPYIEWTMNPVKCPINAIEFYFMVMILTLVLYCVVSWCTMKEPFNLDRMLHRGIYNTDHENKEHRKLTLKSAFSQLLGITPEYTRGDKIIAWAIFLHQFVYGFIFCFIGVVIWNAFYEWPKEWWGTYYLIVHLIVPGIIAVIASFWFGIFGVKDLIQLFRDLRSRIVNDLDNGSVEGNVSVADIAEFKKIEKETK